MRLKLAGNKADTEFRVVKNSDATLAGTMPTGTPVILALNGTDDGLAVVLPSTAGAAATEGLFFGILPYAIQQNQIGECIGNGLANNAIMVRATRSASSASWSSSQSIASWAALSVDTINNGLTTYSASGGVSQYQPFAILAQSVSSISASATATTDTRTAITIAVKAWVQLL